MLKYHQPTESTSELPKATLRDTKRPNVPYYKIPGTNLEMIDVLKANLTTGQFQAFLWASAEEYLWRFDKKGPSVSDLEKALVYVRWLKESVEEHGCRMGHQEDGGLCVRKNPE